MHVAGSRKRNDTKAFRSGLGGQCCAAALMIAAALQPAVCAAAGAAGGGPDVTVAILPFRTEAGVVPGASGVLAAALAEQLAALGHHRVISADEVGSLLEAGMRQQLLGGADPDLALEAVSAMGASKVVTGRLQQEAGSLVWTVSMVDAGSANVEQRHQVKGQSVQALLAQTDDVALALEGQSGMARLTGEAGLKRLGMHRIKDLDAFRKARAAQPELTTTDVLTGFIVANNVESTRLSLLEAAAFTGPVLLSALAGGLCGAVSGSSSYSWGAPGAIVLSSMLLGIIVITPLALAMLATGVGLAVVDGLNVGRVDVDESGCCRDDAEIEEASERNGVRRAAELWVALAAPASCLGMLGAYLVATTVATAAGFFIPPQQPHLLSYGTVALLVGAIPSFLLLCVCVPPTSLVTGLLILLWPGKDAVRTAPAAPSPSHVEGVEGRVDAEAGAPEQAADGPVDDAAEWEEVP